VHAHSFPEFLKSITRAKAIEVTWQPGTPIRLVAEFFGRRARRSAILRRLEVDEQIERGADWGRRLDRGALKVFLEYGLCS
jgi:hypothetical protein